MQYDFGTIDPFTNDGVELAGFLNNWRDAVYTMQRGPTRPAFAVPGMVWVNDAAGPTGWLVMIYLGPTVGDVALFNVDTIAGNIDLMAGVDIEAAGALLSVNNLGDLANVITARSNLGLGALAVKSTVAGSDIALAGQATGDLMWLDTGVWKRLPAGTLGQQLISQGPGVAPVWGDGTPVGTVLEYYGATEPPGFIWAAAQSLLRTGLYAPLFAALSTRHGSVDSTHFTNVDKRGRVGIGRDDMGGTAAGRVTTAGSGIDGATLGASGGGQNVALTLPQSPAHAHTPGDTWPGINTGGSWQNQGGGYGGSDYSYINPAGGGGVHQNMPPGVVCNFIIKY